MSTPLYAPFRSLGHVTTDVPFALHSHATKDSDVLGASKAHTNSQVILTSVGLGWALWSADGLRLLYVGPLTPVPITWLSVHSSGLFMAAAGNAIYIYKRARVVGVLKTSSQSSAEGSRMRIESPKETASEDENDESWLDRFKTTNSMGSSAVQEFISFGSQVVGLSTCGRTLWVWNLDTRELHTTIIIPPTFGAATTLIHPATYLNRIVVASQDGQLAIYNVQTGALIHIFQPTLFATPSKARCKGAKVPVTRMIQGPAVDVLAVGFGDGWCSLVDVRFGEEILAVKMGQTDSFSALMSSSPEVITGIALRSDSKTQILVTSSSRGHLALWDLTEGGRLLHIIREAHDLPISNVYMLPGQPVMVTASGDNSIKQWLFETPTGLPRLLNQRTGHQQPPHLIRFYGSDGKTILSTGQDRTLRSTSVVKDSRSFELSQGSLARKASQIAVPVSSLRLLSVSGLSYSTSRSRDWDDLLTCHEGSSQARTWSVEKKRIGSHSFSLIDKKSFQLDPPEEVASCVCVSACGNYGLVGTHGSAKVGMWNMQSGIKRREFLVPVPPGKGKGKQMAQHVVGIATDTLNTSVIVATRSGHIHFYDFVSTFRHHTVSLPCGAISLLLQRDSGMLAINCTDKQIRILDIDTRQIIRQLQGFTKSILDMTFTPDSRWLVACSSDCVIRTFDLPTGALIDAFRTRSVATSVTFSPKGDFLASAHTDSVGVFLWANRAQFAAVSYKSLPTDYEIPLLESPVLEGMEDEPAEQVELLLRPDAWTADPEWEAGMLVPGQGAAQEGLVTLSVMPKSKWQTLLNLEVIKARNKPKEPPKAPERAPFFLPTVAGTEPRFNLVDSIMQNDSTKAGATEGSKKRKFDLGDGASVEVEFTRRLLEPAPDGDYTPFFDYVRTLSPSALDLEIRMLSATQHLVALIKALTKRLATGRELEMVQAIMGLLLKVHGNRLAGGEHSGFGVWSGDGGEQELKEALEKLLETQEEAGRKINRLVDYGIGVSAFVRGLTGVL